jgi:hypothetical protein
MLRNDKFVQPIFVAIQAGGSLRTKHTWTSKTSFFPAACFSASVGAA